MTEKKKHQIAALISQISEPNADLLLYKYLTYLVVKIEENKKRYDTAAALQIEDKIKVYEHTSDILDDILYMYKHFLKEAIQKSQEVETDEKDKS